MRSIDGLNSLFIGKAKWMAEYSPMDRTTIVSFQCDRRTPVIRVADNAVSDAMYPSDLLASKCIDLYTDLYTDLLASKCIDLYTNHHRIVHPFEAQPTLTCGECRAPVDVPGDREIDDFEFCERQSVLWAERAIRAKR